MREALLEGVAAEPGHGRPSARPPIMARRPRRQASGASPCVTERIGDRTAGSGSDMAKRPA
ncbi:hypothetical protein CAL25_23570 [Bordetella genomosp. 5]|uniref:Uncharacterized protein n=1 Tax=Bordetella genomosp. 5 TaxID=1395608 RepID=A0A261SZ96_9BORD|nr:hypothetical protein CAL25_23570 [Bordetella genomosp. 5]